MSERGPSISVAGIWQVGTGIVMARDTSGASDHTWSLPGGTVALGETLAEAVVRTAAEVVGVAALCGPFVGWAEVVESAVHRITMYFDMVVLEPPSIDSRSGAMPDGPSGAEVRCVPEWEIGELPVEEGLAEFLADQGLIELVI